MKLHKVRVDERIVSLIEFGTVLSPAQLSRWLEHLADEGDAEAPFQLARFNIYATPWNLLKAERNMRQLHAFGNQNAAQQLGLPLHTFQGGPDGAAPSSSS